MERLTFNSDFEMLAGLYSPLPDFTQDQVKNEPMLFSATSDFAYSCGGVITQAFIRALNEHWPMGHRDIIIDSRVHMLMPGWYPCIPGWHLDDVPRTRKDGQPDHANPEYRAEHVMAVVGDCSLTRFLRGQVTLPDCPEGACGTDEWPDQSIYGRWHRDIVDAVNAPCSELAEIAIPERRLVRFDWTSFHRGEPAWKNGWRWFIRASRRTDRKPKNEIRRQVQAYLPAPFEGW